MVRLVVWSKNADRKFDTLIDYLSAEWGESVTKAFVKRTFDFLDLLVDFPEIGSIENANRQIRGFVLTKHVTVFYKVKGNRVVILNFYNNRQNPNKKLYK